MSYFGDIPAKFPDTKVFGRVTGDFLLCFLLRSWDVFRKPSERRNIAVNSFRFWPPFVLDFNSFCPNYNHLPCDFKAIMN